MTKRDIVGTLQDAAAAGAVTTVDTLAAYIKQLVTAGIARDAAIAAALAISGFQCAVKTDGAVLATVDPIFTISGGPVRCKIVGLVTTIIGGAANLRLQHITTDPAATVQMNAGAVAVDTDAVGTWYYNVGATSVFTPTTLLGVELLDPVTVEEVEFLLAPGVVQCLGSGAQTGVIAWYMTYQKLSPLSTVVAAA